MSTISNDNKSQKINITDILGGILWLCQQSDLHIHYRVGDLLRRCLPAIDRGMFRYYTTEKGRPVGFVCWAMLSDEVHNKILNGEKEIKPEDWQTGTNIFFVEFLAPDGHAGEIFKDLRRTVFKKGQKASAVRGMVAKKSEQLQYRVQWFIA